MGRYGALDVCDAFLFDIKTKEPVMYFDSLKISNFNTETSEVTQTGGKGLAELLAWEMSRLTSLEIQDALIDPKAIALKTGNPLSVGIKTLDKREYLQAVVGETGKTKVVLEKAPKAENIFAYISEDGYSHETKIQNVTIGGTGSEKEVIFDTTDVAAGEFVLVYYQFDTEETAETITISSDKFGGYYRFVGDTVIVNESSGEEEGFQIRAPKVKMNSAFALTLDSSTPAVIDFNLKVLKDGKSTTMAELVKY